jgi:hypothetical protein
MAICVLKINVWTCLYWYRRTWPEVATPESQGPRNFLGVWQVIVTITCIMVVAVECKGCFAGVLVLLPKHDGWLVSAVGGCV